MTINKNLITNYNLKVKSYRDENTKYKKTEKNEIISSVFYLLFGSYKSSDFIFKTVQIPHNSKSLTVLSLCSILKISL